MLLGNPVQAPGKHVEFAGHRHLHDQALALVDQVGIALRPSRELPVEPLENALSGTIDEQSVEKIQEAIAGGSLDGPARPQFFVLRPEFFPRPRRDGGARRCRSRFAELLPGSGACA